jgi:hypothetical protein
MLMGELVRLSMDTVTLEAVRIPSTLPFRCGRKDRFFDLLLFSLSLALLPALYFTVATELKNDQTVNRGTESVRQCGGRKRDL